MAEKDKPSSGVTVEYCGCTNAYQDSKYGSHKRVHNITAKGNRRCTVCKVEKS